MQDRVQPKISIVTVVYNDKVGLERTIKSVVSQSYKNIEYIIIDGGSTDGTVEVIEKYREHIAYWVSEADNGIYDAMNKGALAATGDYISFLNATDTYYAEESIASIVSCMEKHGEDVVYYGQALTIDDKQMWLYPPKEGDVFIKKWEKRSSPNHQAMFFPHSFYKSHSYDTRYRITADLNYKIAAYRSVGYHFCNTKIVRFYVGGISTQDCNAGLIKARIIESCRRGYAFQRYSDLFVAPFRLLGKFMICLYKSIRR